MEIGPDKTKLMTNNPKWLPKRDQDKRSEAILEEVENFKYLRSIISNEGPKPTAALSRLKIIWRYKNISLASNG